MPRTLALAAHRARVRNVRGKRDQRRRTEPAEVDEAARDKRSVRDLQQEDRVRSDERQDRGGEHAPWRSMRHSDIAHRRDQQAEQQCVGDRVRHVRDERRSARAALGAQHGLEHELGREGEHGQDADDAVQPEPRSARPAGSAACAVCDQADRDEPRRRCPATVRRRSTGSVCAPGRRTSCWRRSPVPSSACPGRATTTRRGRRCGCGRA